MRIKRRSAVILGLALAGALAFAGIAFAGATSTVSLNFAPSNVPTSTFQKGQITVHTHTTYTGATSTDKAKLNFDNDFKVNTGATPKCAKSNLTGSDTDMADAMARCGSALIGKGTATGQAGPNTVHACVLAFNGSGTGGHVLLYTRANTLPPFTITCGSPASNHQGNATIVLDGALSNNPSSLGGDFTPTVAGTGKQLLFTGISTASPFPLTDFNVTVGKPTVSNAGNFIQARCHDTNHTWNLKTTFTYVNPASSQVVNKAQTCS
jgi:hypothetical protein